MRTRLRLDGSAQTTGRHGAERLLSAALGSDLAGAQVLLGRLPALLPIVQTEAEAHELANKLAEVGITATVVVVPDGALSFCAQHPHYIEANRCSECACPLCLVCERRDGASCTACRTLTARRARNQRVRIAVLLTILFGVCLLAAKEWRRRYLGWERTHRVAVVLVQNRDAPLSEELCEAFANRASAVEAALTTERRRYAPDADAPVSFSVFGPVDELHQPPAFEGSGLWDLLRFNLALTDYADELTEVLDLDDSSYDVRIYMRASESRDSREAAEGLGQQRGRVGVVTTQITPDGIDFAWFVAVHEYLHTRGATDKYDSNGGALYPQGYADPDRDPVLPQIGTELMARGRPESETEEELPGAPDTWVVGKWSAQEIGWQTGNH